MRQIAFASKWNVCWAIFVATVFIIKSFAMDLRCVSNQTLSLAFSRSSPSLIHFASAFEHIFPSNFPFLNQCILFCIIAFALHVHNQKVLSIITKHHRIAWQKNLQQHKTENTKENKKTQKSDEFKAIYLDELMF